MSVCTHQTCFSLDELEPNAEVGEAERIGDGENDEDSDDSSPVLGLSGM